MQNKQKSYVGQLAKHYHSHLPKGSYHSYCRQRINQLELEFQSKTNQVRRNIKSFHTNRQHIIRPSAIDQAETFEQYLEQFQQPNRRQDHTLMRRRTADPTNSRKNLNTKQNKKQQNEQIIESHLPFYRCKIEKTEPLIRRPGFRVKDNKFKVVKNVVENNLINYMGNSMQLSGY